MKKLRIDGLICIGGDGTLNGLQPLADRLPAVLAPKTIDNDLSLNHSNEPDEWLRVSEPAAKHGFRYQRTESRSVFSLDQIVNYVTPGYATAVYVSANAIELQKSVVIVCGEGIMDASGNDLGAVSNAIDPAGNALLSGAADALRARLIDLIGDNYFRSFRRCESAKEAIFTRKVGHTQRGGRPILFDRFHAAHLGAKALEMLLEGRHNALSILQHTASGGFRVEEFDANRLRDRWGLIHARYMHPDFYDARLMKPSRIGIDYLLPIFANAIGDDDFWSTSARRSSRPGICCANTIPSTPM